MSWLMADPIEHDGLTFTLHPVTSLNATIRRPGEVRVDLPSMVVEKVGYRAYATVAVDADAGTVVRDSNVTRTVRGPVSKKQDAIDATAREQWAAYLDHYRATAVAVLDDPAYVARCANVSGAVVADLKEKVRNLKKAITEVRHEAAEWLEVAARSTGTLANREKEAAMKQAHLAAAVETWAVAFRPFVDPERIVEELMGGPSFGLDDDGNPFKYSLFV